MHARTLSWTPSEGWDADPGGPWDLVLAFASRARTNDRALQALDSAFPAARRVGCTTAGNIRGTEVSDESMIAAAIRFEHTGVEVRTVDLDDQGTSRAAGAALGAALRADDLAHVLVFSDGIRVNGTELCLGLGSALPSEVTVTGGLAADGTTMAQTLVHLDGEARSGRVVGVGLHGSRLRVACGSLGGWDPFGPERVVTRARGNVLYELDHEPALRTYVRFLGPHAAGLPASGLLFPLALRAPTDEPSAAVVRTVLAVDHEEESLTFAGDLPEGWYARMMRANLERLVDGASGAAQRASLRDREADLALLVSCVGRRMILRQRIEEEIEAVREVLGPRPALVGFYSNGEISPLVPGAGCDLHNQTMTITTFTED